jgi:predicted ATP-grasp superfamily ATP-dependent carboligase
MSTANPEKPVVLVTAVGAPPGLNTLRALLETGLYDAVAADADKYSPALYGFGVPHVVLPRATDEVQFIDALKSVILRNRVSVILPCIEEEVFAIARHARELTELGVRLPIPSLDVLNQATNKGLATKTARECGIPCPESIVMPAEDTAQDKEAALVSFHRICPLPWILKPVIGHGMRGVSRVETLDEARALLCTHNRDVIIQEFIPAPVGCMHIVGLLYDREGRVVRRFSSRSIRTLYPAGGPATAGVSIRVPEIIENTIALLARIGPWRGPLMAEWLRDPRDNRFKFIEVNPRIWGYSYLAAGSGSNFPAATAAVCLNGDAGPDPGFKEGVTMIRITHDLIFPECPFDLDV